MQNPWGTDAAFKRLGLAASQWNVGCSLGDGSAIVAETGTTAADKPTIAMEMIAAVAVNGPAAALRETSLTIATKRHSRSFRGTMAAAIATGP